jgi:hypothetical protein
MKHTMATIKQITAMSADDRAACNQAAFDLITASGVVPSGVAYHDYALKHWPKGVGLKPGAAMLALPYILDPVRRGGRETMQFSMGLRPEGVTVAEYTAHWFADGQRPGGAAHNNISKYTDQVRGGIAGVGWFARLVSSAGGHSDRFHYVITDKGMAHLTKRVAALTGTAVAPVKAKPVKVARKRNAEPAPAEPVPVEPVAAEPVTEPATPDQLAALAAQFNS